MFLALITFDDDVSGGGAVGVRVWRGHLNL